MSDDKKGGNKKFGNKSSFTAKSGKPGSNSGKNSNSKGKFGEKSYGGSKFKSDSKQNEKQKSTSYGKFKTAGKPTDKPAFSVQKKTVPIVSKVSEKPKEVTLDLIYMTPNEVNAKILHEYFVEKSVESDIWESLNILQIELANKNTVEFEPLEPFTEKSDLAFIKNREIKTMFALTIDSSDFDTNKTIFKGMLETFNGFICNDSEDFSPIYKAEDL